MVFILLIFFFFFLVFRGIWIILFVAIIQTPHQTSKNTLMVIIRIERIHIRCDVM